MNYRQLKKYYRTCRGRRNTRAVRERLLKYVSQRHARVSSLPLNDVHVYREVDQEPQVITNVRIIATKSMHKDGQGKFVGTGIGYSLSVEYEGYPIPLSYIFHSP